MAKGNLFLGAARGKVGSLVFKRQNGEQVTVPRVTPSNPRSKAQMMQRLALSSASKTAAALDEIISHSFQNISYGQKSRQAFVKEAAKLFEASIKRADDGQNMGTCAAIPVGATNCGGLIPVTISKGELKSPIQKIGKSPSNLNGWIIMGDLSILNNTPRNITVADYESIFGVPMTDQLTFVIAMTGDAVGYPAGVRCINYHIKRLNWIQGLPSNTVLFNYNDETTEVSINSAAVDSSRSSADIVDSLSELTVDFTLGGIDLSGQIVPMSSSDGINNAGFAIIASRFEDGKWKRSTQRLMVKPGIANQATGANINTGWGYNYLYFLMEDINTKSRETEDQYLNKEKNK